MVEVLHRGPAASDSNALARHGDTVKLHHATHNTGGTDAMAPADIGAATSGHTHTGLAWTDRVFSLTDSTSVTPNALSGQSAFFTWLMTAASTLNPPSNPSQGQIIRVAIKPSSALNLTISASFIGSSDYATGVVALTSGKWHTFVFQYISDIGWQYTGKSVSA